MVDEKIATHHDSDSEQDFTWPNCKFVLNQITGSIGSQSPNHGGRGHDSGPEQDITSPNFE